MRASTVWSANMRRDDRGAHSRSGGRARFGVQLATSFVIGALAGWVLLASGEQVRPSGTAIPSGARSVVLVPVYQDRRRLVGERQDGEPITIEIDPKWAGWRQVTQTIAHAPDGAAVRVYYVERDGGRIVVGARVERDFAGVGRAPDRAVSPQQFARVRAGQPRDVVVARLGLPVEARINNLFMRRPADCWRWRRADGATSRYQVCFETDSSPLVIGSAVVAGP